jgi:hypothetical protein
LAVFSAETVGPSKPSSEACLDPICRLLCKYMDSPTYPHQGKVQIAQVERLEHRAVAEFACGLGVRFLLGYVFGDTGVRWHEVVVRP